MADEPIIETVDTDEEATDDTDNTVDDVLVEEVSIDGMCGVY